MATYLLLDNEWDDVGELKIEAPGPHEVGFVQGHKNIDEILGAHCEKIKGGLCVLLQTKYGVKAGRGFFHEYVDDREGRGGRAYWLGFLTPEAAMEDALEYITGKD